MERAEITADVNNFISWRLSVFIPQAFIKQHDEQQTAITRFDLNSVLECLFHDHFSSSLFYSPVIAKVSPIRRSSANEQVKTTDVVKKEKRTVTIGHLAPRPTNSAGHLNPTPELTTYGGVKLGWIQGVLIPCLLNIWGVMLFLRISWIVGQAGILLTLIIILLSAIVCVLTTLSLSAICTNGELQGGGVYYLVSRSLGAELGASIGIVFAFANAVAASMNTIGFCDSLNDLLQSKGLKIIDNSQQDVRIVGAIALLVMCVICAVGMNFETKVQNFLLVIIIVAILNFIIGAFIGPRSETHIAEGFVGISIENARKNLLPDFRESEGTYYDFFSIFALYFPAVTGVQAGANICGDLRHPASAIPKGTLLALAISMSSYIMLAALSGMGALRDASGDASNLTVSIIESCKPNCDFGLHNNYEVMQLMSAWGPFIYGGCWAATLSTALTNLLSVPRLIQALGVDRIYPGLIFFSKPYGRYGEPYRGYVLTFFISLVFLLIGDLNSIAPLISNFYLASYALINFCTFHAALVQQINWRPSFHCYNPWLSLTGFVMCVVLMTFISWIMTLITIFIFLALYLLVIYAKPDANWGSSAEARQYQTTLASILKISRRAENVKLYNPQVLVMAGKPYERPGLIDMAHVITRMGSFMIVADVEKNKISHSERLHRINRGEDWMMLCHHRAFYVLLTGFDLDQSVTVLAQAAGLGRLVPNVLLMGYQDQWTVNPERVSCYVRAIQNAIIEQLAVAIFRLPKDSILKDTSKPSLHSVKPSHSTKSSLASHSQQFSLMHSSSDIDGMFKDDDNKVKFNRNYKDGTTDKSANSQKPESSVKLPSTPHVRGRTSVMDTGKSLDAWWLYDDGGLNILLPYIIARRAYTSKKMPLRIFANTKLGWQENSKIQMKNLLARFRIDYSELIMIESQDLNDSPSATTWQMFNDLIENFKGGDDWQITETELQMHNLRIRRHLRIRELLLKYSTGAGLIVMTLPLPRKGISPVLYMACLEMLSSELPPMLFVRGNDNTVLAA